MRIGYSFWGFLADVKEDAEGRLIDAPDGNATYSWSIIHELQRRGHSVHLMQENRDWPAWRRRGKDIFAAFSQEKRTRAFEEAYQAGDSFPELDVLLVEWRFPIQGRNCDWVEGELYPETGAQIYSFDPTKHQPDFARQIELLRHYCGDGKTKVVFWDLDHKLTVRHEEEWKPAAVFETSQSPLKLTMERTQVEPPTVVADLLQHPTLTPDQARKLVYVGSRYERDDVITEWIKPVSETFPEQVEFWGNWLKTLDECRKLWPHVSYHGRITTSDFHRVYSTAGACPLLAKGSYRETGFMTPRPWEALLFGTIPVGLKGHLGVERYVPVVAQDARHLGDIAESYATIDVQTRDHARRQLAEQLEFMDVRHFVDKLLG